MPCTWRPSSWIRAAAALVALTLLPTAALAAGRLFTVVAGMGMICEIDPVTGAEIFSFNTPGMGVHPGLAFNNTELFYTDETLAVVKVYLPDGTFIRDMPKPGVGPTAGAGLGVSATSLFGVGVGDETITAIDPVTGAFQSSFFLNVSKSALAWAGSRGTIFVRVGDTATVKEVLPNGTVVNTITTPVNMSGLAFSSSLNRLFGVVTGTLYGLDPNTGALLPGYPVSVTDSYGYGAIKTGAAAADEIPTTCGDEQVNAAGETCDPPGGTQPNGNLCRDDCTYCGDSVVDGGETCDAGAQNSDVTPNACRRDCTLPLCGDGVVDAGEECDPGSVQTEAPALCRLDCTLPRCGDERLDAGEDCDDGNQVDGDGCSANCTPEFCGDGIVQPLRGETCELPSTPGCDAQCRRTEICNNQIDDDQNGAVDCEETLCACLPIERDPGIIRFGAPGSGKDYFSVHGSFSPVTPIDPTTEPTGILLANDAGTIYAAEMPGGSVLGRRGKFKYRNAAARTARNGVYKLDIRFRPRSGNYTFWLKAYADLSAATDAMMTLQWHVGDDAFVNTSAWEPTSRGWELHLPGE